MGSLRAHAQICAVGITTAQSRDPLAARRDVNAWAYGNKARPRLITPPSHHASSCSMPYIGIARAHRTQAVVPCTHHCTPGRSSISNS